MANRTFFQFIKFTHLDDNTDDIESFYGYRISDDYGYTINDLVGKDELKTLSVKDAIKIMIEDTKEEWLYEEGFYFNGKFINVEEVKQLMQE